MSEILKRWAGIAEAVVVKALVAAVFFAVLSVLYAIWTWLTAQNWQIIVLIVTFFASQIVILALLAWVLMRLRAINDHARASSVGMPQSSDGLAESEAALKSNRELLDALCKQKPFEKMRRALTLRRAISKENWQNFVDAAANYSDDPSVKNDALNDAADRASVYLDVSEVKVIADCLGVTPPRDRNPRYSDNPMASASGEEAVPEKVRQDYRKIFDRQRNGREEITKLMNALDDKIRENDAIIARGSGIGDLGL